MATKYYTLCRHTGPALPHGTSGRITVLGYCPHCRIDLSQAYFRRPLTTMKVTEALLKSYRNVKTSQSR